MVHGGGSRGGGRSRGGSHNTHSVQRTRGASPRHDNRNGGNTRLPGGSVIGRTSGAPRHAGGSARVHHGRGSVNPREDENGRGNRASGTRHAGGSSRVHRGGGSVTPAEDEDNTGGEFTRHGSGTRSLLRPGLIHQRFGRHHRHDRRSFDPFRAFRRDPAENWPSQFMEPLMWRRSRRNRRQVIPEEEEGVAADVFVDDEHNRCCCYGPCFCCCCWLSCVGLCLGECFNGLGRCCGNWCGGVGRLFGSAFSGCGNAMRSTIPVLMASTLLFAILCVFSSQNETWTLNAGETRQIHPTWLTRAVEVQYVWSQHDAVGISVYAFAKQCPPLTGPIKSFSEQHSMTFGPGDFQFDYFYLNKGSKVEADFTQMQGSSNVYLLKGQDKVSILQNDDILHDEDKWSDLLRSAKKSWKMKDRYSQPTVGRFQADKNDVYTLLYDNPYSKGATLLVDLWFDMTTYQLKNKTPICSDIAFDSCAPIETEFAKCIILDTSSWHDNYQGNEDIVIRIRGKRDYSFIAMLSFIPIVLGIFYKIWSCLKNRRRNAWQLVSREDYDEEHAHHPSSESRPPATAPPATEDPSSIRPSAPPASEDQATEEPIPVAAAQLVEDASASTAAAAVSVTPVEAPRDEVTSKR